MYQDHTDLVELVGNRYDGLFQNASPREGTISITELDPISGVAARYIYERISPKRFSFKKAYEVAY